MPTSITPAKIAKETLWIALIFSLCLCFGAIPSIRESIFIFPLCGSAAIFSRAISEYMISDTPKFLYRIVPLFLLAIANILYAQIIWPALLLLSVMLAMLCFNLSEQKTTANNLNSQS